MSDEADDRIRRIVAEHQETVARFFETGGGVVARIADLLAGTLEAGGKILLFGNGGSAADAQHMAGELVGGMGTDRPGLAAVALTTDTSVLTSLANDFDFPSVFARQVRALGRRGDAAVGITTSGRSANVVKGLREARRLGLHTVALLGEESGPAGEQADIACRVPASCTPRIQEVHAVIGHLVCDLVLARCRP